MRGFLGCERGSTRLAATIAVGVLAILGLAVVPMVLSQSHNAQDSKARSALTRLAQHVETCRVSAGSYRDCDERAELVDDNTVRWGGGPGEAGMLTDRSEDQAFTAYVVSGNGSRTFVWTSRDNHVVKQVCAHGSVARLRRDGCDESRW